LIWESNQILTDASQSELDFKLSCVENISDENAGNIHTVFKCYVQAKDYHSETGRFF